MCPASYDNNNNNNSATSAECRANGMSKSKKQASDIMPITVLTIIALKLGVDLWQLHQLLQFLNAKPWFGAT